MPDRSNATSRLPIKLILPSQGNERRVPGGGSPPRPFREVTTEFRNSLATQVEALQAGVVQQVGVRSVVPARVKLHPRALAKSHRPSQLFSERSCPIIGAGGPGEIFVKASANGLEQLLSDIRNNDSDRMVKQISTVETIEPITATLRTRGQSPTEILTQSPRMPNGSFLTRIRLFDVGAGRDQDELTTEFARLCERRRIQVSTRGYDPRSFVYAAECKSTADVEALSNAIAVRSIAGMPILRTLRPNASNLRAFPSGLSSSNGLNGDFPVVGVVDSGIRSDIPVLESWVVGRESTVAPTYQNPSHGTFVAGLICWGSELNPNLPDVNADPCGVFDLQVLPNWRPEVGDVDTVSEAEFLQTLESALRQHSNRIRVWNLSLSTSEVCSLDSFSAMAEQLDNLQERYQVSFVIAAGNYETLPLLNFPRTTSELEAGRITAPADSVLGVTVGAISHLDYAHGGPKHNELSPFSRHGAGPNFIVKPDLVHYGGACSVDTRHVAGITSIAGDGIADDVGTSFATPLVSRSLAQIYHHVTPSPSPVLARGLLTHHARDPRSGARVPDGDENYFGFGRPLPPPYSIACEPFTSTLVFDDVLRPGFFLEWDSFPYPPSLIRDGKFYGEIWMTVAFAPARGARWGTEYCETHIDAHFGVYQEVVNRETGEVTEKFAGQVPPEHKDAGGLYEDVQVRQLRKWAPVRTYHGDLSAGVAGTRWRLKVQLLSRHGVEDTEALRSQPFSLLVTIADPTKSLPIYDEMAQIIRARFQSQNIGIRTAARLRVTSNSA